MDISVVIPVYNEGDNVIHLHRELKQVLERLNKKYEIIFVDDGSNDNTFENLKKISKNEKSLKIIQFTKNFQKAAALMAGFNQAKGEMVITMDGDLQDDPCEIPKLIDAAKECDVVVGWRHNRTDKLDKKIPSKIFNALVRFLTGIKLHDSDCNFRIMKNYVVRGINIYGGLYRYIPIIAHGKGYNIKEIKVNHRKRLYGKSKYGMKRIFNGIFDLITVKYLMTYTKRPLHFFGMIGFVSSLIGFLCGLYLLYIKYANNSVIGNRPLLFLAILLIVIGMQFFSIGLIGEMITSYNNKLKDQYIIKSSHNL